MAVRMEGVSTFVARMLATENLNVIFSNIPTAAMDVQSRTMYLPIFKEENGESVNDLFVAHEVGHALWTPKDGWHQAAAIGGLSKDILNIVEDIRIEKLMKRKYPGLHGVFNAGYTRLLKNNFFGLGPNEPVDSLDFLNRLNVKTKGGDLVTATFTGEEKTLFDSACAVETFDDVKRVVKEIMDYLKRELQKQPPQQPQQGKGQGQPQQGQKQQGQPQQGEKNEKQEAGDQDGQNEGGDQEGEGENQSQGGSQAGDQEGEGEGEGQGDGNGEGEEQESKQKQSAVERQSNKVSASLDPAGNLVIIVKTDRAARANERKMVENSAETKYVTVPDDFSKAVMHSRRNSSRFDGKAGYADFLARNRESAQALVIQFNLFKAAHTQKMQSDRQSGQLDPGKLPTYKFNDNLFRKTTVLPRSQNHGIVMVVDGSSSMQGNPFNKSLQYICTLAEFCLRLKIPFEAYGFTSGGNGYWGGPAGGNYSAGSLGAHTIHSSLKMVEIIGSNDPKAIRNRIGELWTMSKHNDSISTLGMNGGTPLEDAMLATAQLLTSFQKKHSLEQVHTVLLSDGEGMNRLSTNANDRHGGTTIISVNGKRFKRSAKNGDAEPAFRVVRSLSSTFTTFYFVDGGRTTNGDLQGYIRPQFKTPKTKVVEKEFGIEAIDYYERDSFFLIPVNRFTPDAMKKLCQRTGKIIAQYRETKFDKNA